MLGCTLDRPRPPPQPRSHVFAALDADAPAHQCRLVAAGHAPACPRGADAGVRGGPRDGAPGAGAARGRRPGDPQAGPRNLRYRQPGGAALAGRSEEHTSELQSLMRISYAVFCLNKKKKKPNTQYLTSK